MPSDFVLRSVSRATGRVPGLRRIPIVTLLALADVGMVAREHYLHLTPYERRRLVALVRTAHGRPSHLGPAERDELADLVAKLEPGLLAGLAAQRLSPLPLPHRLIRGRKRSDRSK